MANLLHIKGSRTKVLNSFPTRSFGKDGDIVISKISGKGTYLCSKAGGTWYTANKLQELSKLEKASIKDLSVSKLSINNMANSSDVSNRFLVNNDGKIQYRTNSEVFNDLNISDINYKTAHCSLGQYTDKESCEDGGGTWYYSENDSHDSISNTAENQLLTVSQSIGNLDAEPTLLHDGSTLEIKYNSDFDDNWQTSGQTDLLKLTYDTKSTALNLDSGGNLTVDCSGTIELNTDGGQLTIKDKLADHFLFDCDGTRMFIYDDTSSHDYLSLTVAANGVSIIATNDNDGTVGHLTLDADGDITLDAAGEQINIDNAGTTFGTIDTAQASKLRIIGTTDYQVQILSQGSGDISLGSSDNILIDATDAITFDSDGTYIMMKDGTEFSVANSAYAGMIIGYTSLLNDAADTSYGVTTSFVTIDAAARITFVAPPSGNVEIFASVYVKSTSTRQLYFGLSDNATYNAVDVTHEHEVYIGDETDEETLNHQWVITGLTAGSTYTYFLGAKAAQAGRLSLHWGGDVTNEYAPFIMKATALPATLYEG